MGEAFQGSQCVEFKKAIGLDGVSPHILKSCVNELCYPICFILSSVQDQSVSTVLESFSYHFCLYINAGVLSLTHDFVLPNCCPSYTAVYDI